MPLRELNRWLHLNLPTDGPKTLNGLILETLEDIPDGDVSVQIAGVQLRSDAQRRPGDPHGEDLPAGRRDAPPAALAIRPSWKARARRAMIGSS